MPVLKPNLLTQLPPKTPSVLIRTARYAALLTGIVYGYFRLGYLKGVYKQKLLDEQEMREFINHRRMRFDELRNLHSGLDAYKSVFGYDKPYNKEEDDRIMEMRARGIEERTAKRNAYLASLQQNK